MAVKVKWSSVNPNGERPFTDAANIRIVILPPGTNLSPANVKIVIQHI